MASPTTGGLGAGAVSAQYPDGRNLDARMTLHRRFGANAEPWFRWVFDRPLG